MTQAYICDAIRTERDAEIALSLRDELTNSWSVAHGGVTMTLLDVVMAHAARSPNQPGHAESPGVVTIEMKTSFMRPAKVTPGGRLTAKGRLMHRTKSMAFTEGTIYDEAGLACAHATGTFKYVNRAPDRTTEAGIVHPQISTD